MRRRNVRVYARISYRALRDGPATKAIASRPPKKFDVNRCRYAAAFLQWGRYVASSRRGAREMTRYFPRVAIVNASGVPLRHVHGDTAQALVGAGVVVPRLTSGRVREVVLANPASSYAQRIGEPSPPIVGGTKFTRWRRLDESATRVIEHHPRCLWR